MARVTNTETGASVQRNLASFGTVTLNVLSGDNPPSQLVLLSGRTVLHGAATGEKMLVSRCGRHQNLCETLA